MKTTIPLLIAFLFLNTDLSAQIGRLALSPLQTLEQKIGLTDVTIVYSRPSKRGRDIFGALVPYDKMWRTGANRNTTIQFSEDVLLNNTKIKAGKYAIYTIPSKGEWEILLYDDTSNWDVPEEFIEEKVVGRMKVKSENLTEEKEVFTIAISDFTNYEFTLDINWSDRRVSVPIQLTTREMMDKKIARALGGPNNNDYYAAAVYEMESGHDFQKGLEHIMKIIDNADDISFWDIRVQAILLMEMGRNDEAKKVAEKGLKMAQDVKSEYGISEFNKVLSRVGG